MKRRKFIKGAASAALGVVVARHLPKQSEPVVGVDPGTDEGSFIGTPPGGNHRCSMLTIDGLQLNDR